MKTKVPTGVVQANVLKRAEDTHICHELIKVSTESLQC